MKVIEILNKIANEEKIHFIVEGAEYYVGADGYLKDQWGDDALWNLDYEWLNEEVEILEEKKIPEKLENYKSDDDSFIGLRETINVMYDDTSRKINEIIDYLKIKGV